ncbi:MAG TPA: hypothetical protein VIY48_05125, partial [Candidatus Paceibacterota bacterium]
DIVVSTFEYDISSHARSEKPGTSHEASETWFSPAVMPYVRNERIQITKGLEWCGELQILPTAKRPISGFEAYTGRNSCIIPHPKFALESVASGKYEGTKLIYTTGCVTERNYIQKKAGQLAQFHHGFGGLLVEVDEEGRWFCRQLNASEGGTLYDLDVRVSKGKVTTGHRVEAVVWGDAHVRRGDPTVDHLAWGMGDWSMIDVLQPKYQFFHDLLDFRSRNHHEINSGRKRFERWAAGGAEDSVALELQEAAKALWLRGRDYTQSVVVNSNHDRALLKWLDTADYRMDPKNALTFLDLQTWVYRQTYIGATRPGNPPDNIFEYAMKQHGAPKNVRFLQEDESFIICPDANGGIECGMHGDLGVNGGRGSAIGFARMGRKSIVGHGHSTAIVDGVYIVGHSAQVDLGYNKGPSSWSHSHCVVYPNGKRTIITMWKGKWRA